MSQLKVAQSRSSREPLDEKGLAAFLERATKLHGEGRLAEASELYEHVHTRNPDVLSAPYFLALIYIETGFLARALELLRFVTRRDPHSFEPTFALAYTFQELGQWRQAVDGFRRALTIKPTSTSARFALARALEVDGRLDEAIAAYRTLAANAPTRTSALAGLALIRPLELTPEEVTHLTDIAWSEEEGRGVRIGVLFALGEVLEAQHRFDEAFAAFCEANRLRRLQIVECDSDPDQAKIVIAPPGSRSHFSRPDTAAANHSALIQQTKRRFTSDFIAAHVGAGRTEAPIFIVGMPRSGSTLIEQILSSHPKVQGLGESPVLARVVARVFGRPEADDGSAWTSERIRDAANLYLERQRAFGWDGRSVLVDKMLGNYMHIGHIHLMFPQARILHAVRDPVDTCLGCFRKLFRSGNETTYDLEDIAAHYCRYREMMAHWEVVVPGRVKAVVHEDLLNEPDREIRTLVVEDCGLKWDDACLTFHRNKRPVRTASVAQVRKPISRAGLQRWRHYEPHLAPLLKGLGPFAPHSEQATTVEDLV
jgi:tetratricopeptide (TPR) repeat protein